MNGRTIQELTSDHWRRLYSWTGERQKDHPTAKTPGLLFQCTTGIIRMPWKDSRTVLTGPSVPIATSSLLARILSLSTRKSVPWKLWERVTFKTCLAVKRSWTEIESKKIFVLSDTSCLWFIALDPFPYFSGSGRLSQPKHCSGWWSFSEVG